MNGTMMRPLGGLAICAVALSLIAFVGSCSFKLAKESVRADLMGRVHGAQSLCRSVDGAYTSNEPRLRQRGNFDLGDYPCAISGMDSYDNGYSVTLACRPSMLYPKEFTVSCDESGVHTSEYP